MESNQYVEQTFPIQCKGRSTDGKECLDEAVDVKVKVYKSPDSNTISSRVECRYNTGAHGQRCTAFDLGTVEKSGKGISCPYSFDIPQGLERK